MHMNNKIYMSLISTTMFSKFSRIIISSYLMSCRVHIMNVCTCLHFDPNFCLAPSLIIKHRAMRKLVSSDMHNVDHSASILSWKETNTKWAG